MPTESIGERINRIPLDLKELRAFYTIASSPTTYARLETFYTSELDSLRQVSFKDLSLDDRADYLLIKNWLVRERRNLRHAQSRDKTFADYVEPFAAPIRSWIERRMRIEKLDAQRVAGSFHDILVKVKTCREVVDKQAKKYTGSSAYRAVKTVRQLRSLLAEMNDFYAGFDPLWDWWVKNPYKHLDEALEALPDLYMEKIAGIVPGDTETIVGEPIGGDALLNEIEAEMIPYNPEELVRIAEEHYAWCEKQMITASTELGYGKDWREGLEYAKTLYVTPGSQPNMVKDLINEGTDYVKKHDLITVPQIAEEAIRMIMIPPATQKVSPFFLGGPKMFVSYPTAEMSHPDKLMSMRGNSRPLSKAVAHHEMIPGHHLQLFMADRIKPHRKLFETPFYIEGWAVYWEMVLWNRGDFYVSPEDRIGAMFWRMHRCARIVFSLNFHLGKMTPAGCVEYLVHKVGHERATAEGEVRRSCGEEYSPLYQAGYLLGALQLWKLRGEVLGAEGKSEETRRMSEKEFHDRVLRCNMMPIEMVRNLLLEKELAENWKSSWKFHDDV